MLPAAIGTAVLRYRLYEIDVVINRTLVYGSSTAPLVASYLGGVVGLQYVIRALSGGESQLAVVASTLVVAALFNPLRRRIQGFIDRRFYRRGYDARKILEAFSFKLRDETDIEVLNNDLVGVIRPTMQPTSRCGCALIVIRRCAGVRNQAPLRPKPDPRRVTSLDVRLELWSLASCLRRKRWLPTRKR